MSKKIRVAVLYGGRSGEHEISLQSAASVIRNLDPERYEIIPVGIDKQGKWHLNSIKMLQNSGKSLPIFKDTPEVVLPPNPQGGETSLAQIGSQTMRDQGAMTGIDVVFPVMHGPLCEDGTVQGLMELADVAYVGCGVLASSVGMDKDVAKRLARDAGLPVVPFVTVRHGEWKKMSGSRLNGTGTLFEKFSERVAAELGFPCFVKPANMGSSVGVHKVKEPAGLVAALDDAFRYDTKVLIEKAIDAREIELAVLENSDESGEPLVSVVGEIAPTHEFYSYEAKYLDENGAALILPAELTAEKAKEAQELAKKVFTTLECEGMTRVDLFLDRKTGEYYLNEINTIPGFTQISMYPKLWGATGIGYQELLTRLIDLAMARHRRKRALVREFLA